MKNDIINCINSMTLEEKVGQLFIVGLDSPALDSKAIKYIQKHYFSAFILYDRNILTANQTKELCQQLQQTTAHFSLVPSLIGIDHEGGNVSQFPYELSDIPSHMALGASRAYDFAYDVGCIMGDELRELGINLNFAPVLDLNNGSNPAIDTRTFSDNPETIIRLASAMIKGLQDNHIMCVAKHFPSFTSYHQNHYEFELKNGVYCEDIYTTLIGKNLNGILAESILCKDLDPEKPASISHVTLTDYLKNKLDYNGLIISLHDFNKKVIQTSFAKWAIDSFLAGSDMMLLSNNSRREIINTYIMFLKAVKSNKISEDRLNHSLEKILTIKEQLKNMASTKCRMSSLSKRDRLKTITQKTLTLVRDSAHNVPLQLPHKLKVLVLVSPIKNLWKADNSEAIRCNFPEFLAPNVKDLTVVYITKEKILHESYNLDLQHQNYDLLIILSQNSYVDKVYREFYNNLSIHQPTIVLSIRHPSEIIHVNHDTTFIATYGHGDLCMEATVNLLVGAIQPEGVLPVKINE